MRFFRRQRPSGLFKGGEIFRIMSLVGMLGLVYMLYQRAGDPDTWRWLANDPIENDTGPNEEDARGAPVAEAPTPTTQGKKALWQEVIVEGPTDLDSDELEAAKEEYQALSDRSPLSGEEMPSYWRFMRWSRAQSFAEMQPRARRDILFTDLFERPDEYRGDLLELKLHVRRTLSFKAPKNSAGVKQVYEAWGWTEDSKSYPYVVVFSDLPRNMPLGPDIFEEAIFRGYFLKTMSYQAYDVTRAAPLLVGSLEWRDNPARTALKHRDGEWFWPTLIGGMAILTVAISSWFFRSRFIGVKRPAIAEPAKEAEVQGWLDEVEMPHIETDVPSHRNGYVRPSRPGMGPQDWTDFPSL